MRYLDNLLFQLVIDGFRRAVAINNREPISTLQLLEFFSDGGLILDEAVEHIAGKAHVHPALPKIQRAILGEVALDQFFGGDVEVKNRVRNEGVPAPCQCRPTMSKRAGGAAASVRSPCRGTSRLTIVTASSASAAAGQSRKASATAMTRIRSDDPAARVAEALFDGKGGRPFPDRIFTK